MRRYRNRLPIYAVLWGIIALAVLLVTRWDWLP